MIILITHIIVSYDKNISLIIYVNDGSHAICLVFTLPPVTVHCSTKGAFTSEITFLALNPCALEITNVFIVLNIAL